MISEKDISNIYLFNQIFIQQDFIYYLSVPKYLNGVLRMYACHWMYHEKKPKSILFTIDEFSVFKIPRKDRFVKLDMNERL